MSDATRTDREKRTATCRFCEREWDYYFYPTRPRPAYNVCAECTAIVAHDERINRRQRAIAAIRMLH